MRRRARGCWFGFGCGRRLKLARLACGVVGLFAVQQISGAPITVTDDFNRSVTLAKPAERILSLSPHNTENLFSAGAGSKVVGGVEHSDYPPAAARLASVGNSYARINLEAVLALAPDLVVAWETAGNRETLQKIAQLGFQLYYSEPRNFADIIENIEELALLAGSSALIHPPAAHLREELAQVRAQFGGKSTQTVFYQVWREPLMTINGAHLLSRALELCGARNAFAHLPIIAPQLSLEAILQADPDIIITARVPGQPPQQQRAWWKKWASLSAVQHDGFVWVDGAMHRNTARMIMGLRNLCEQIDQVRQRREN